MPALNFQERWVEKIVDGSKHQTIRANRKRPIKVGDRLVIYIGQRTKECRKIGTGVCSSISFIRMSGRRQIPQGLTTVHVDGRKLHTFDVDELALADGFVTLCGSADSIRFLAFFLSTRDSFDGQIIKWEDFKPYDKRT